MKKSIFAVALAALSILSTNTVSAQSDNGREERRAEMRARQTERLVRDLKLTDEQKQQFEPVYQRYLNELQAAIPQEQREQGRDRNNPSDLTDSAATVQLQQLFDRQEQQLQQQQLRLEIQKKYLAEFSAFLTPQQLLRVFTPQQRNNNNQGRQQGNRGQRGGFGGGQGGPRGGFGGGDGGDF